MTSEGLSAALRYLCEIDPPRFSWQWIEMHDRRADIEELIELGAATEIGASNTIVCLACDHPHSVTIEYAGDGRYRFFCTEAGYQKVESNALRQFVVNENWIASSVASPLGLTIRTVSSADRVAIRIGRARFGPYACELFFARGLSERDRFAAVKRMIAGLVARAPAVLLTTTAPELIPAEPLSRCAIILLDDVLKITPSGTTIDEEPIHAALRGKSQRFRGNGIGFVFSPGFRSAVIGDREYTFADKQALVVEALYDAWQNGSRRLHQTEIQGTAETNQRIGQLFRGHPAYDSLIKHDGAGYYWLDL
jgi:hypothetical protein